MAAILPLAETVVLGVVDGAIRAADNKGGRSTHLKQWSTYVEAGMVGVGAVLAMQRMHPDWWEPLVVSGLFALSQRGGAVLGHAAGFGSGLGGAADYGSYANGGFGGRAAPGRAAPMGRGLTGPYPPGYRPYGGADPAPVPVNFPSGQHVLPAGSLA